MRRFRPSLRLRVAAGFALLGVAVSLILGTSLYLASWDLEQRLVDDALSAELEDYLARLARNPRSLPPETATVRGYLQRPDHVANSLPDALQNLPQGRYTMDIDGVSYRVAVHEQPDRTLYMLHDQTQLARREQGFALVLIVGVTLTTLLSAAGGWWLAGRVIAPVRELAGRVRGRDATDLSTPLGGGFPNDELGELAQTFDRYLARLRAFVERERAFVTDASHELRTPLSVIQGAVEVLYADKTLHAHIRHRLDRIARATRAMSDFTTTLLMLARERPGETKSPPACSVEEVLREAVELHRPQVRHKPVSLELSIAARPTLAVERPLLAIALGNLVRNACTYTEQGWVRVTLDATEVTVSDSGPGIPPEELACLFEHCERDRRTVRGAGIGLPLVKRITDRQGWRISAESRAGEGAVFRLQFAPALPSREA
ncbi:MAG: HAMP domain-containing sensor histidine kinase [Chromatiaceae bacterium]